MVKFLKPGKVVILLSGRYAGHKAVIVQNFDDGTSARPYGHCIVVGIDRYPLSITKSMSKKKVAKRTRIKTFTKVVNYNHIMPTRYAIDMNLRFINSDTIQPATKTKTNKVARRSLQARYNSGKDKWFFAKLRF